MTAWKTVSLVDKIKGQAAASQSPASQSSQSQSGSQLNNGSATNGPDANKPADRKAPTSSSGVKGKSEAPQKNGPSTAAGRRGAGEAAKKHDSSPEPQNDDKQPPSVETSPTPSAAPSAPTAAPASLDVAKEETSVAGTSGASVSPSTKAKTEPKSVEDIPQHPAKPAAIPGPPAVATVDAPREETRPQETPKTHAPKPESPTTTAPMPADTAAGEKLVIIGPSVTLPSHIAVLVDKRITFVGEVAPAPPLVVPAPAPAPAPKRVDPLSAPPFVSTYNARVPPPPQSTAPSYDYSYAQQQQVGYGPTPVYAPQTAYQNYNPGFYNNNMRGRGGGYPTGVFTNMQQPPAYNDRGSYRGYSSHQGGYAQYRGGGYSPAPYTYNNGYRPVDEPEPLPQ